MISIQQARWFKPQHEISKNVVHAIIKASDQPAHTHMPAHMHSLIRAYACCLNILWLLSYWLNTNVTIWSF